MRKKYTDDDFHRLAMQTNRARWGLTIAFISWCLVAVILESRSSEPELIAMPEYTEDGRQILAQTDGPLHWPAEGVDVYYNASQATVNFMPTLEYMLWTWQERTGQAIVYRGRTYETEIDGAIVVNFQSPFDMWLARDSWSVRGYAASSYYPSTGQLAKSSIYLRTDQSGDALLNVAVHELGHSLGVRGHNDDPHGVMYATATRYALTASDVKLTAYEHRNCHAEVSPTGEVYLPGIQGAGITLHEVDGALLVKHEHHSGEYCTGSIGAGLVVTVPDVRGFYESYRDVVLVPYMGGWTISELKVVE
ncbi:MAG: hypothetical protein CMQ34_07490 [Gammaproteobacteria bacterium]|nr:hypothetical protein [Gammaproteobacteria bacterium]|tara:strand:+ start:5761 stop:6678 length:918 start_codon:yes stop_codon:yes gene_type:complete